MIESRKSQRFSTEISSGFPVVFVFGKVLFYRRETVFCRGVQPQAPPPFWSSPPLKCRFWGRCLLVFDRFRPIFGQFWSKTAKIDSKSAPFEGSVAGSQVTKEGVPGSEIEVRNCKSLATFHRALESQCSIAQTLLAKVLRLMFLLFELCGSMHRKTMRKRKDMGECVKSARKQGREWNF